MRQSVLALAHTNPISGHFGVSKTINKIKRQYVWPNMYRDVKAYIKFCLPCQQFKYDQNPPAGKMTVRRPVSVWHTCHCDLLGPLPRSTKGHKYLVIFQDQMSKAVELAPLKKATALSVAKAFINNVYTRHGAPHYLVSDNGTQFTSNVLASVCKVLGIQQTFIVPYTPRANVSERGLRDISRMIASYVGNHHERWDAHIPQLRMAMNCATQCSTKFTPYFLLYGRDIRVPLLSDEHLRPDQPGNAENYAKHLVECLRSAHLAAQQNAQTATATQKRYFDAKRSDKSFRVHDIVWLASHNLSDAAKNFAAKLAPKRTGPFKITQEKAAFVYVIQCLQTGKLQDAHADQLQYYFCNNQPLPDDTDDSQSQRDPDDTECCMPVCAFPDSTDFILCDLCDAPYHCACIGVTLDEAEKMDFICVRCRPRSA